MKNIIIEVYYTYSMVDLILFRHKKNNLKQKLIKNQSIQQNKMQRINVLPFYLLQ